MHRYISNEIYRNESVVVVTVIATQCVLSILKSRQFSMFFLSSGGIRDGYLSVLHVGHPADPRNHASGCCGRNQVLLVPGYLTSLRSTGLDYCNLFYITHVGASTRQQGSLFLSFLVPLWVTRYNVKHPQEGKLKCVCLDLLAQALQPFYYLRQDWSGLSNVRSG